MDKYVIKIIRRTPESWDRESEEDIHYYDGRSNNNVYFVNSNLVDASKFTGQESKEIIKEIKRIYKENTDINGTLLKIEILGSETFQPIIFHEPKYTSFTRFEIMDI